ncbi:MAG: hypothetical protein R3F30_05525 [Planctomycetota bacterium]
MYSAGDRRSSHSLQRAFADLDPGVPLRGQGQRQWPAPPPRRARLGLRPRQRQCELLQALRAGADPAECAFAGVGKQDWEIRLGLRNDIGLFNVESEAELERIDFLAEQEAAPRGSPCASTPDVAVGTHDYIATGRKQDKFGIDFETAARLIPRSSARAACGCARTTSTSAPCCSSLGPYLEAAERVLRSTRSRSAATASRPTTWAVASGSATCSPTAPGRARAGSASRSAAALRLAPAARARALPRRQRRAPPGPACCTTSTGAPRTRHRRRRHERPRPSGPTRPGTRC